MQMSSQRTISAFQYHFEQLRHNRLFELLVVAVIIFSALLAGAETYDISHNMSQTLRWLDYVITLFFLLEISIRFLGEADKRDFFKSGWNIFDTVMP